MLLPPYHVFREQLSSLYRGHALWVPDPAPLYQQVSIGDVGYVQEGYFVRMFNVLLEWDNPSNRTFCVPERYTPLNMGPFDNIRKSRFIKGEYHSRYVTPRSTNTTAMTPDDSPYITYSCVRGYGALLVLPYDGIQEDVIRTKVYEDYIRDNVDNWFAFAQRNNLGVDRMEDLILVTGCTLATSWGVAAFIDNDLDAEFSLRFRTSRDGGATFDWRVIRPDVVYRDSYQEPANPLQNQCVFIKGFRAKRVLIWTRLLQAAAEVPPDDPEDRRKDEMHVTRVQGDPTYGDPLIGVLDHIAEKCSDNIIAIAHDDDLRLVQEVDTFTADAIGEFLHRHEIGVLIENGAAVLQKDEGSEVPDEAKLIFFAEAESEGGQVPLILHPALSKYLLKLNINHKPIDHDYDLPSEEITSPAVYPPVPSLKLENHQGYPQPIIIGASSGSPDTCVTVQDVLRTIHEDVRKLLCRREWIELSIRGRAAVDAAYKERCNTGEGLDQGPCRIDYLRGRDRLQILPKTPIGRGPVIPVEVSRDHWDATTVPDRTRTPMKEEYNLSDVDVGTQVGRLGEIGGLNRSWLMPEATFHVPAIYCTHTL